MLDSILNTFLSLFDTTNQLNILYKKEFGNILSDYSYAEMHTIDVIGKIKDPNVTKIAKHLNITKAGISKIIKKLLLKKAILTYKNSDNKKETYYKLTQKGNEVFLGHLKMHKVWHKKDRAFFKQFNEKELKIMFKIINKYNLELQERLENIKENIK